MRPVSHATAVQMAIKQAQINNRAFLASAAASTTGAAPLPLKRAMTGAYTTGSHLFEVSSARVVLALRVGDAFVVVDHDSAKTSELVKAVDALLLKASTMKGKPTPYELETVVDDEASRLALQVGRDGQAKMYYRRDESTPPVPVEPVGPRAWQRGSTGTSGMLALRFGDQLVVTSHPNAKNSKLLDAVEALLRKASGATAPSEFDVVVDGEVSRLQLQVSPDGPARMHYQRDESTLPVAVDPVGPLAWKL